MPLVLSGAMAPLGWEFLLVAQHIVQGSTSVAYWSVIVQQLCCLAFKPRAPPAYKLGRPKDMPRPFCVHAGWHDQWWVPSLLENIVPLLAESML